MLLRETRRFGARISPVAVDVWKQACGSFQTLLPGPSGDGMWACRNVEVVLWTGTS